MEKIIQGKTYLGIELGSTRIKASLIDDTYTPIASGSFGWENRFTNGFWTYSLEEVKTGVQECFADLLTNVKNTYGVPLERVGAMGVSAMMHGYLAFDETGQLLVPFRTWRNTTTAQAAEKLTKEFGFHIPQRWSIAHLYQAILNKEEHISGIAHITTLAGYVHYLLTGRKELGIGDASGMFPVKDGNYHVGMMARFDELAQKEGFSQKIGELLPDVRRAGEVGACLSEEGARWLDPTGVFKAGSPVCPPEGDAGTGMVATNGVLPRTGNVSAGTSVFAMLVLEKPLQKTYGQIDMVTTPDGFDVAMVHCNNCCGEIDAWVEMFGEFAELTETKMEVSDLYEILYRNALSGACDHLMVYNYLSGEHITDVDQGSPMYFRVPGKKMKLADFFKTQLYSALATLTLGMKILFENEQMQADRFSAHGGLFKVPGVAQQILASALKTSVSVMDTAGEGGAWGMALLSAYMMQNQGKSLGEWLEEEVFTSAGTVTLLPDKMQSAEFEEFLKRYQVGLEVEKKTEEALVCWNN